MARFHGAGILLAAFLVTFALHGNAQAQTQDAQSKECENYASQVAQLTSLVEAADHESVQYTVDDREKSCFYAKIAATTAGQIYEILRKCGVPAAQFSAQSSAASATKFAEQACKAAKKDPPAPFKPAQ